jgi:hypothetical protein
MQNCLQRQADEIIMHDVQRAEEERSRNPIRQLLHTEAKEGEDIIAYSLQLEKLWEHLNTLINATTSPSQAT